jgi:hypothetical protein
MQQGGYLMPPGRNSRIRKIARSYPIDSAGPHVFDGENSYCPFGVQGNRDPLTGLEAIVIDLQARGLLNETNGGNGDV